MKGAVLRELAEGERRVAAVPATVEKMVKVGMEVCLESEAGLASGFQDGDYREAGARVEPSRDGALDGAAVVLKVQKPGADELDRIPEGCALIAYGLRAGTDLSQKLRDRRITALSLDLLPRIARAQSMDVLSSMANIAGYKGVLLGAGALGKFFPMLMTAAGTVAPAKVLVIGAGVAGLQAIATARRLGAVVSGFDVRPVVKEQVESLGAKFLELGVVGEETEGGYARELSEEEQRRQQEELEARIGEFDVVVTTALIPGRPAPRLIPKSAIESMQPGSVIVDLAAEAGGNAELTRPDEDVVHQGVTILGPTNLPSTIPYHA